MQIITMFSQARDDLKESAASSGGKKSKQAKNAPAAEKPAHLVVCEHTVRCTVVSRLW